MAITYTKNNSNGINLSYLFFYQFLKQAVSSPGFLTKLYDETTHSSSHCPNQETSYSLQLTKKPNSFITTQEQLMLITAFFGFSKSKLAEIFGVTRQSIYNWFNDDEPVNEHWKKIKRLADVVSEVTIEPSQPIFHIYANEIMEGYAKSLFNYLLDDNFDKETVVRLSKTIYEMSKERWERIDAISRAKYGASGSIT
jgi:DNA-binding XRE family transcriptional regulator